MSDLETIEQRNSELAQPINKEARANPNSSYAGKFVGIANGEVVVVDEDLDRAIEELNRIEPDRAKTFNVEAGADYDEAIEIWSLA
jgi:hypothetical protein